MKTFKDLEFNNISGLNRAFLEFDNGYGISVISGKGTYSNEGTYEVAILYKGELTYNTHITGDVLGWQTPEQITEVIKQVQEL